MSHYPHAWTLPAPRPWDATAVAGGLEAGLTACLKGTRAGYFLFMWLVTAYEAAMMAGVPILYPAIQSGVISPDAAMTLYETASRSHTHLLPAVVWFLIYQGLPALDRR